jgi:hypothetical protein
MPIVHKKNWAEPLHGHTHELLVPMLNVSFPTTNAASFTMVQGDETLKKYHSTHHKTPNPDASAVINTARPFMARDKPPIPYTLELFCGDSLTFPRGRPSVRVLVRGIKALNYIVEVFPLPNNDIDLYPDEDWIIVVKIGETSL